MSKAIKSVASKQYMYIYACGGGKKRQREYESVF